MRLIGTRLRLRLRRPSSLEEGSVWLHLAGARGHICISNRFSDPEIDPPIHQTDQIFEPGPRGRLYPSNAPTKSGQTAFRYPVIYAQGFLSSISLRFFFGSGTPRTGPPADPDATSSDKPCSALPGCTQACGDRGLGGRLGALPGPRI